MLGLQLEINVILYRQTHSKKDDHLYQNLVIVDIANDKQTGWPWGLVMKLPYMGTSCLLFIILVVVMFIEPPKEALLQQA